MVPWRRFIIVVQREGETRKGEEMGEGKERKSQERQREEGARVPPEINESRRSLGTRGQALKLKIRRGRRVPRPVGRIGKYLLHREEVDNLRRIEETRKS